MKKFFVITLLLLAFSCSLFATDWTGTYHWTNPTKKDNKGKMKELTAHVVSDGKGSYEVYLLDGGVEYRVFPLFLEGNPEANEWHKYKEKSPEAECFRMNNERFNTSSMNPGKWKVQESEAGENVLRAVMVASAFNMEFDTISTYTFAFDEDGNKTLRFATSSESKMAKGVLFENPDPASDGSFVLTIEK